MRWLSLCLALSVTLSSPLLLAGCEGCGSGAASSPADPAPARLVPVPAPEELLAEMVIPSPEHSWSALRNALGNHAALTPKTVGGLTARALGLPLRAVQEIDERLPMFAAVGEDAGQGLLAAASLHVKDGAKLVVLLSTGADATFESEREAEKEITWLIPDERGGEAQLRPALAVIGNYLVVGSGREAVEVLGPYLARTLPARHPGGPSQAPAAQQTEAQQTELRIDANGGALARVLKRGMKQARGSSALETLRPLLDVEAAASSAIEMAGALGSVDISLVFGESSLELVATGEPLPDAAPPWEKLPLADTRPMATLPDDTLAALAWSETATGRVDGARRRAEALRNTLRADGAPGARLEELLVALAEARGDDAIIGLRCTGAGVTGFASGTVADEQRLGDALRELVDLRRSPAVAKALESAGIALSTRKQRLERIPHDVFLVRVEREGPAGASKAWSAEPIDLRHATGGGRFFASAGAESVDTLQLLYRPEDDRNLSTRPELRPLLADLPERAFLALLIDARGVLACGSGTPGSAEGAPMTLSLAPHAQGQHAGPHAQGLRLRLVAANDVVALLAAELLR